MSDQQSFHSPSQEVTNSEDVHVTPKTLQRNIRTVDGVLLLDKIFSSQTLGIEPSEHIFDVFVCLEKRELKQHKVDNRDTEHNSPENRVRTDERTWKSRIWKWSKKQWNGPLGKARALTTRKRASVPSNPSYTFRSVVSSVTLKTPFSIAVWFVFEPETELNWTLNRNRNQLLSPMSHCDCIIVISYPQRETILTDKEEKQLTWTLCKRWRRQAIREWSVCVACRENPRWYPRQLSHWPFGSAYVPTDGVFCYDALCAHWKPTEIWLDRKKWKKRPLEKSETKIGEKKRGPLTFPPRNPLLLLWLPPHLQSGHPDAMMGFVRVWKTTVCKESLFWNRPVSQIPFSWRHLWRWLRNVRFHLKKQKLFCFL